MNTRLSLLFLSVLSLNIHTHNYQEEEHTLDPISDIENTLRQLCQPVKTTASGFTHFLQNIYNSPLYAQEVLPNDFSHIVQFLEHGRSNKQPRAYAQSVLRLFANKLKGSTYVNNYAFTQLSQLLPQLLQGYFLVQRSDVHTLQEKINKLMYYTFVEKFSTLKSLNSEINLTSEHVFFQDLSQEILDVLNHEHEINDVTPEELRKTLLIFLEITLSKLIWGPQDKMATWNSVKSISEQLATLMDCNVIIDFDDLNGLFVTLVERYCFFLDIAGEDLSATFYEELKADIASSSLLLLELEEQEHFIESKKDRLQRAIQQAQHDKEVRALLN